MLKLQGGFFFGPPDICLSFLRPAGVMFKQGASKLYICYIYVGLAKTKSSHGYATGLDHSQATKYLS